MHSRFTVVLSQPRARLFDYLADPRNRPRWQSSIRQLQMLSDGAPHVGMRWREVARGFGAFEMEITRCEFPALWAERGRSGRGRIDLELHFAEGAVPGETELSIVVDLQLRGVWAWAQWGAPLVLPFLMRADLKKAARLVGEQAAERARTASERRSAAGS